MRSGWRRPRCRRPRRFIIEPGPALMKAGAFALIAARFSLGKLHPSDASVHLRRARAAPPGLPRERLRAPLRASRRCAGVRGSRARPSRPAQDPQLPGLARGSRAPAWTDRRGRGNAVRLHPGRWRRGAAPHAAVRSTACVSARPPGSADPLHAAGPWPRPRCQFARRAGRDSREALASLRGRPRRCCCLMQRRLAAAIHAARRRDVCGIGRCAPGCTTRRPRVGLDERRAQRRTASAAPG